MRTLAIIVALALPCWLPALTPAPQPVGIGQFAGYTYEVRPDVEREAQSNWDAEREALPILPVAAIAKGRAGLKRVVGAASENFFCSAVRFERPGGLTKLWFYVVEFQSADDTLIIRGPGSAHMWPKLHFIIYLSREIEIPVKTKPVIWR